MTARPFEREAATANWSLRLALLPIPLLILAGVMHRLGQIETTPFFVVIAIAWALAAMALVLGGLAMRRIWIDGLQGFGPALAGSLLALAVLAMPGYVLAEMVHWPRLADISTDPDDPPALGVLLAQNRQLPGVFEKSEQVAAYPDILARHYPVSTGRVFTEAMALVQGRGWTEIVATSPDIENAYANITAVAKTLLLSLPVDVSIRILAEDGGSLVDMRSASRIGAHDLGDNARRIRAFFVDLDAALQGVTETDEAVDPEVDLPPLPPVSPKAR